ncbi:MAG: glycosyltransferase [Heyndrickxia sp.]
MNPKISIVVPIFNVENYLRRCLDSLITQTLSEIEIIAVNDGSTDSSLTILKEYADRDNRITIINKKNEGVSSARNVGIWHSTGQYIGFVDPDDWIDSCMYDRLYHLANDKSADIVMCTYIREFTDHSKVKHFDLPIQIEYNKDEIQGKILRRLIGPLKEELAKPEFLDAWGTVWSKIYRTDLIKKNQLQFVDLNIIGTNEDSLFNMNAFYHANLFIFTNMPYYHYWRENNLSVTTSYKPLLLNQWFTLYSYIEKFLEDHSLKGEFQIALKNRICLSTLGLGLNTISLDDSSISLKKRKNISLFLNDVRIKNSFKKFELSHFPLTWKVFYFCAKNRLSTCFYLLLMTISWLRRTGR